MKPLTVIRDTLLAACAFLSLNSLPALSHDMGTTIKAMPKELEVRFALSSLPKNLRATATAYVLDPASGYKVAQVGTSGIACLVERTVWELGTDRDDIYIPLCYDPAGLAGQFRAIKDAAAMRAKGASASLIKATITKRYQLRYYKVPSKAGLSYMAAPIMRTKSSPDFTVIRDHPDLDVQTMSMPHMMIYASGLTNKDIGARPDINDPATLSFPFIDIQGTPEQAYMIQPMGQAETAKIISDEKALIDDLCNYRAVLCLQHSHH